MAYTPSANKTKTQGYASNFSNLQNDAGRNALTGAIGNRIQTSDATATAVTSPITALNGSQTLVVPPNASSIVIASVTNAVQVSEDSTMSQYFQQPAGTIQQYDIANQNNVYLKTTTTTSVSWYFVTI